MTPSERHEEKAAVRMARLEQEVDDLREMLERLIAESYNQVGPMSVTVREAQRLLLRTGPGPPIGPPLPSRKTRRSPSRSRTSSGIAARPLPGRRSVLELRRRSGHRPRGHARRSRRQEMGDHGRRRRGLARHARLVARPRSPTWSPMRSRARDCTGFLPGRGNLMARPVRLRCSRCGGGGFFRQGQLAGLADPRRRLGRSG